MARKEIPVAEIAPSMRSIKLYADGRIIQRRVRRQGSTPWTLSHELDLRLLVQLSKATGSAIRVIAHATRERRREPHVWSSGATPVPTRFRINGAEWHCSARLGPWTTGGALV